MVAPSLITNYGEAYSATNVADRDVPEPADLVDGMLSLICVSRDGAGAGTTSVPTNYTSIDAQDMGSHRLAVFAREFASSEPSTITIGTNNGTSNENSVICWTGVQDTAGLDVSTTKLSTGNTTSITLDSITTAEDDCLLVIAAISEGGNSNINTPSGWTSYYQRGVNTSGAGARLAIFYKTQATAGATGTVGLTQGTSTDFGAVMMSFLPEPAGTTYNDTLASGSITVSDSVAVVVTAAGGYSESVTVAQTFAAIATMEGSLSGSVTVSDALAAALTINNNNVSEPVTPDFSLSPELVIPATFSESITATESIAAVLTVAGGYSEAVTPGQTFAVVVTIEGATSESVTPDYALATAHTLVGAMSESVTPDYSLAAVATMEGGYSESVAVDGTFAASALVMNDTIGESVTPGGDFDASATYNNNSVSESATVSDSFTAVMAFSLSVNEPVTPDYSLAALATMVGALSESVTAGESLSAAATVSVTVAESVLPGESISCANTANAACTEPISVTDSLSVVATIEGAIAEGVTPNVALLDEYTGTGGGGGADPVPDYRSPINSPIVSLPYSPSTRRF